MSDVAAMRRTYDWIQAHPDQHNQGQWMCGTSACWAGWTVLLERGDERVALRADDLIDTALRWTWTNPETGQVSSSGAAIELEAQYVQGLTFEEAEVLFHGHTSEAEALDVAAAIIGRDEGSATAVQVELLMFHNLPIVPSPSTAGGA